MLFSGKLIGWITCLSLLWLKQWMISILGNIFINKSINCVVIVNSVYRYPNPGYIHYWPNSRILKLTTLAVSFYLTLLYNFHVLTWTNGWQLVIINFRQKKTCLELYKRLQEDPLLKAIPLPTETLTTLVLCLQRCVTNMNVSPDCQEAIVNVVNTCTMVLKSRQQNNLLRGRALDTSLNPSLFPGPMYGHTGVDQQLQGLGTNLSNLTLAGQYTKLTETYSQWKGYARTGPSSNAFNLQGGLGPLVQSPGSPSRIISGGPSNSPFPLIPMQHQGPVGTGASLVLGVNQIGSLSRIGRNVWTLLSDISNILPYKGPNGNLDKARVPEYTPFTDGSHHISKEIEDEANNYFQRIYNHPPHPTLSIDEVLNMLKRFQDSPNKREKEVSVFVLQSFISTITFL